MIKKILISQPKPASEKSPYYDLATDYDVELVFRPFIKVEGLTSKEFRAQKVSFMNHTAVVFTSRHAIDNYFKLAKEMRIEVPEDMKYFCVTEQISLYIQKYTQYRKRKVFFGNTGKIADMLPLMVKHKTENFSKAESMQTDIRYAGLKTNLKNYHIQPAASLNISTKTAPETAKSQTILSSLQTGFTNPGERSRLKAKSTMMTSRSSTNTRRNQPSSTVKSATMNTSVS